MPDVVRLVDTSILIDLLRGHEIAKTWVNSFSTGQLAISVITAAELIAGCQNKREQALVEKELTLYPLVYLSGPVSATALEWYRQFHLSHNIGFLDCLIGSSAYHNEMTVCTLNNKHFNPLPNLQVERPY
jgi:predicted nucleic acid-binding protein